MLLMHIITFGEEEILYIDTSESGIVQSSAFGNITPIIELMSHFGRSNVCSSMLSRPICQCFVSNRGRKMQWVSCKTHQKTTLNIVHPVHTERVT